MEIEPNQDLQTYQELQRLNSLQVTGQLYLAGGLCRDDVLDTAALLCNSETESSQYLANLGILTNDNS